MFIENNISLLHNIITIILSNSNKWFKKYTSVVFSRFFSPLYKVSIYIFGTWR